MKTYYSGIGGQAVLDGVMMKNRDRYAVAVRKPDRSIDVNVQEHKGIGAGHRIFSLPLIRGVVNFIDSLVLGVKTIMYSAGVSEDETNDEEPSRMESWLSRRFGEKAESIIMGTAVVFAVIFSVLIFMILPLFLADLMRDVLPFVGEGQVPLIESVLKIAIFILYVYLISFMPDIKRTYQYHGAEHKCINCVESGRPLTVENVRKSSRFHKRCGTSFLLIVMIVSIFFFVLIRSDNAAVKYGIRLLLVPVIAGISYEFIRLAGRSSNIIVSILSKPGLLLQRITTAEPDDGMIKVGIASVEAVFDWRDFLRKQGIDVQGQSDSADSGDTGDATGADSRKIS